MEWSPGDESPWDSHGDVPDPVCFSIMGVSHDDVTPVKTRVGIVFVSKRETMQEVHQRWLNDFNCEHFNVRELRIETA